MSNWEQKSKANFRAANKLITDSLANESVHCSYYSCVQYMLHILNAHFGMTIAELDTGNYHEKTGTHKWLKDHFYRSLFEKDETLAIDFYDDLGELNDLRNTADYRHDQIGVVDAEELRQLAYKINTLLRTTYQV